MPQSASSIRCFCRSVSPTCTLSSTFRLGPPQEPEPADQATGLSTCLPASNPAGSLTQNGRLMGIPRFTRLGYRSSGTGQPWNGRRGRGATALASGEDPGRVARSYGRNAERLIKAERRYDLDNIFGSAIPLPIASAMAGAS
jgi:hypothetical protein